VPITGTWNVDEELRSLDFEPGGHSAQLAVYVTPGHGLEVSAFSVSDSQ
jgi:hypothetical protein